MGKSGNIVFMRPILRIIQRYQDENLPWMQKVLAPVPDVEALKAALREYGAQSCLFANLNDFKDRFSAVKADFKEACPLLAENVRPDVIYLDADKSSDMLEYSRRYFPEAIICGDDWTWGEAQGFPTQAAGKEFCSKHNLSYKAEKATWIIDAPDVG